MKKPATLPPDALRHLLTGVDTLADAAKVTLGPKGRSVLLEQTYSAPRTARDGVSVVRGIELSDRYESMGAEMIKEVALRTHADAGDGTTTAAILAQSIIREGAKAVAGGMNPMDLKRGIDLAVSKVVGYMTKISLPVDAQARLQSFKDGELTVGRYLDQPALDEKDDEEKRHFWRILGDHPLNSRFILPDNFHTLGRAAGYDDEYLSGLADEMFETKRSVIDVLVSLREHPLRTRLMQVATVSADGDAEVSPADR